MLYLLPNLLHFSKENKILLPSILDEIVPSLDGIIAESESAARAYLSLFSLKKPKHHVPVAIFNKKQGKDDVKFFLEPILKGEKWGYLSDCGLPCIADPGTLLVRKAKKMGIEVKTLPGPSSLMEIIALSGLPFERFFFWGYLPSQPLEREKVLLSLEKRSLEENAAYIFIEAPHRNSYLLESCLKKLSPKTYLMVAQNLQGDNERVRCERVQKWQKLSLEEWQVKDPAIFLLYQNNLRSGELD